MKKQNILISGKSKKVIFLPFIILVFIGFSFTQANAQKYCMPIGGFGKLILNDFVVYNSTKTGLQIIEDAKIQTPKMLYRDVTKLYVEGFAKDELHLKMGGPASVFEYAVWVDWNKRNGFESSETVVKGTFTGVEDPHFTIPAGTKPGDYRLRFRMGAEKSPVTDPCYVDTKTQTTGVTMDYTVRVLAPTKPTDAAIDKLISPDTSTFLCSAEQDIKIRIVNQGSDDLKTVAVKWSLNGATQTGQTIKFNPLLKKGDDKTVTIATHQSFPLSQSNDIKVWTADPNGKTDENHANDTLAFNMTVNEATADITPSDTTICEGTPLTLNSGNSNSSATTKWSDGSSQDNINVTASGQYYVTVTDGKCTSSDTINVTIDPLPAVASIQESKQNDESYDFIAKGTSDVSTYSWDFGDGKTSTKQFPNHKYAKSNTYTVTLIVANNCGSDTATTTVNYIGLGIDQNQLNKELQLYPNPASDVVILKTRSDKNISSVSVYNILGEEVYQRTINNRSTVQLDVNNYSSGIYSISIEITDGTSMQRKFQVTK